MEKRRFKTTWKRNQKYGDDRYQLGKIVGIAEGMGIDRSPNGIPYGIYKDEEKRGVFVYCTDEEYERFKTLVTEYFLNECDFDVQ